MVPVSAIVLGSKNNESMSNKQNRLGWNSGIRKYGDISSKGIRNKNCRFRNKMNICCKETQHGKDKGRDKENQECC